MKPVLMLRLVRLVALICVLLPRPAWAADPTFFRLFLINGDSVVSFGEFARVEDRVIFSMPVGGSAEEPRLHLVSLPAGMIDWERTDRHASSSRYQRYADSRGDDDFRVLTTEVARVLSNIASTTDRRDALGIAEQARRTLADWPRAHYGYRQDEVRDVIGVLDGAISSLRAATGIASFELALVATAEPIELEAVATMPTQREQLDQIFRVITMTSLATERVALLQAALALLDEAGNVIAGMDATGIRKTTDERLREELTIDARYVSLSTRLAAASRRAAERAKAKDVEKVLSQVTKEDARLGRQRPELVYALQQAIRSDLDSARQLQLLRDRWRLRQVLYRDYQRSVGSQIVQLVKAQPVLESIRALEGTDPDRIQRLRRTLVGGAELLDRVSTPDDLDTVHGLVTSAWRFAETALRARYEAIASGNLGTAREASSAAAGALMMLNRAQEEIRTFLEPPRLP
jgi:hypothetical protein